jgi:hypothetical protein
MFRRFPVSQVDSANLRHTFTSHDFEHGDIAPRPRRGVRAAIDPGNLPMAFPADRVLCRLRGPIRIAEHRGL